MGFLRSKHGNIANIGYVTCKHRAGRHGLAGVPLARVEGRSKRAMGGFGFGQLADRVRVLRGRRNERRFG